MTCGPNKFIRSTSGRGIPEAATLQNLSAILELTRNFRVEGVSILRISE